MIHATYITFFWTELNKLSNKCFLIKISCDSEWTIAIENLSTFFHSFFRTSDLFSEIGNLLASEALLMLQLRYAKAFSLSFEVRALIASSLSAKTPCQIQPLSEILANQSKAHTFPSDGCWNPQSPTRWCQNSEQLPWSPFKAPHLIFTIFFKAPLLTYLSAHCGIGPNNHQH